jgi:hypothetical protein
MLRMPLLGGMRSGLFILASIAWHWITLLSLVRVFISLLLFIQLITIILATSVDVERVFSQGRLLLSHIRSRLSVQSTRALMCLGVWSKLGFITDSDVKAAVLTLPELNEDDDENELDINWDRIN